MNIRLNKKRFQNGWVIVGIVIGIVVLITAGYIIWRLIKVAKKIEKKGDATTEMSIQTTDTNHVQSLVSEAEMSNVPIITMILPIEQPQPWRVGMECYDEYVFIYAWGFNVEPKNVSIEVSTNFVDWETISSEVTTNFTCTFDGLRNQAFYRAKVE